MLELLPGSIIAVSGQGAMSNLIQVGTVSLPNIGPLSNWAGISHVGIVANVFGDPLIYESTSFARPPCERTKRENPTGVQAHYLEDILEAGGKVWYYPIRCKLYADEEERLLEVLEDCLARNYDFFGAARAGGGRLVRLIQRFTYTREALDSIFCNELCSYAWARTGIWKIRNAGWGNPNSFCRRALRQGICDTPQLLS